MKSWYTGICLVLIIAVFSSCSPRKFNDASNVKDEPKPEPENIKFLSGLASMGIGGGSVWNAYNPKTKYITLAMIGGGLLSISGLKIALEKSKTRPIYVEPNGFEFSVALMSTIGSVGAFAKAQTSKNKFYNYCVVLGSLAASELFLNSVNPMTAGLDFYSLRPPMAAMQIAGDALFYVSNNVRDIASKSSQKFMENIGLSEFKSGNQNAVLKLSNADSMVDSQGRLLDYDLIQLAIMSEYMQGNKPGFSANNFVRQLKIAATLPYDMPIAEFEKQKITDPVARNVFINRGNFKKVGLM